ncbi:MAG: GxxExxY protein [Candidatus Liptonbacteria bacterium]|nr:GxxExxY protein [Candidatus Liptonbacteria bacterium]
MRTEVKVRRADIIEPELSYAIVGALFEVANTLGPGYSEAYYQRAVTVAFKDKGLKFQREVLLPVKFHGEYIGRQRCDFVVEGKVLVELKKGSTFSRHNIEQVFNYLRASGLKLAILANFSPKGVVLKRVVNSDSYVRTYS